jgi:transcriptional regulator with XRE-family HTH domain
MAELRLNQTELAEQAGLSESAVSRVLKGSRSPQSETLIGLARALGIPLADVIDPPAVLGVAGEGYGSAADPQDTTAEGARLVRGGVRVYRGYLLWGREDPRDPATAAAALGETRRVMREEAEGAGGGVGPPEDVFAVLVADGGLETIETTVGPVRSNWRLFVDGRTATSARLGSVVAAMGATGVLVVGELQQDSEGAWSVWTGPHREPVTRSDVLGEVVEYQPAASRMGRVRWQPPQTA